MRAAVLAFAFDHLGAVQARSAAFTDNHASLRVSQRLGLPPRRDRDGRCAAGSPTEDVRLLLTAAGFVRPDWSLEVDGLDPCRPLLGA